MKNPWNWINVSDKLDVGFSPVHLHAQHGGLLTRNSTMSKDMDQLTILNSASKAVHVVSVI